EQAICREALKYAFVQHREMAVGLKGVQKARSISDAFDQTTSGASLVDLMRLDMLVGSGGVLSHSPRRVQGALMMLDGFLPEGFTILTVDSIFMMPQLGVLAKVQQQAALEVFHKDCLIYLGTAIAPVGPGKEGDEVMECRISIPGKPEERIKCLYGDIRLIPLGVGEKATIEVIPGRKFDVGAGKGKPVTREAAGGVVGLIFDTRGRRPFELTTDPKKRVAKLTAWNNALGIYPEHSGK
ncbi:MAG: glutamate mutase L, partial [Candidatus Brocadiia bacterium]